MTALKRAMRSPGRWLSGAASVLWPKSISAFQEPVSAGALIRHSSRWLPKIPACRPPTPCFQLGATWCRPLSGTWIPINFGAFERQTPRRAPILGEHTDEILSQDLGMSDSQIGSLRDAGVVAGPIHLEAY